MSNAYGTGNTVALGKSASTPAYYDPYLASRAKEFINWTAGFQRQITKDIVASVTYVGSEGHFEATAATARGRWSNQLPLSYAALGAIYSGSTSLLTAPATPANIQAAAAAGFVSPNPYSASSGQQYVTQNYIYQYLTQFPQYAGITDYAGHVGNSNFHAIELSFNQREAHGLTFMANYTYSKSIDDTGTIRQGYNDRLDRSISVSDQPQNITATAVYKLPFGHGHFGGDNYWPMPLVVAGIYPASSPTTQAFLFQSWLAVAHPQTFFRSACHRSIPTSLALFALGAAITFTIRPQPIRSIPISVRKPLRLQIPLPRQPQ